MVDSIQVRVSRKTHKKLMELRKTEMGTVRIHEVIDRLVDFWEEKHGKKVVE
jgi:hypothetical protein